jgi:hypothetical protein
MTPPHPIARDGDDWIDWPGGERPVHGETRVICRLRDGRVLRAARSRNRAWDHEGDGTDTVAYRVVSTPPSSCVR